MQFVGIHGQSKFNFGDQKEPMQDELLYLGYKQLISMF